MNPIRECYISTGDKCGFYTLRVVTITEHSCTDNYVRNLSIDWDQAVSKAVIYSKKTGAGFVNSGEFSLSPIGIGEAQWKAVLNSFDPNQMTMPSGKYCGKLINELSHDYKKWLIDHLCGGGNFGKLNTAQKIMLRIALIVNCDYDKPTTYEINQKRFSELKAQQEAEKAAAEPCPSGKIEIRGTVVSIKTQDTYYGSRRVMTVKDDRGFLVWGTNPAKLGAEKGDIVKFTAIVQQSDSDDKFGFFTRPSKCQHIYIELPADYFEKTK